MAWDQDLQHALETALKQEETPASLAVQSLIQRALELSASDIHLDPQQERLLIRFRMDGVLHDVAFLPKSWQNRLIGKIKVFSNLLTYREDLAQEGRISDFSCPIRVSIFPTLYGEKTTLRIFQPTKLDLDLETLGFDPKTLSKIQAIIFRPQGMFLLTGPSGSGKSTTIYTILQTLNQHFERTRSIITIEDPIEVPLEGIVQTQLNRNIGLDFQGSLRTILRHDPDMIMIGEIRDRETAEIAIEAGLTGHFIISTIHSGRAIGVFGRLLEMEIEPYLLTSALTAVLAQRLIRLLCPECERNEKKSCPSCHGIRYKGRAILYEFVPVEGPIRTAILQREDMDIFKEAMKALNCETLMDCAQRALFQNKTRTEEITRVLG
ncbi:MAG: GspE/PulE family protein [Planctomycetota bacterium]